MSSFCVGFDCDDCSYKGMDCCRDLMKEDAKEDYERTWGGDDE